MRTKKTLVRTLGPAGLPTLKIKGGTKARNPGDIAELSRPITDMEQEFLVVFNLKATYEITSATIVAIGDRGSTVFPQCQIFKSAIIEGAEGVVIVHNHPGGNVKFSKTDKKSMKKWMKIGNLLEIKIIDMLVLTKERWRNYGWLSMEETK